MTVPQVTNMSQDDANNAITAAGLQPMVLLVFNNNVANGIVVSQDPVAGYTLKEKQSGYRSARALTSRICPM